MKKRDSLLGMAITKEIRSIGQPSPCPQIEDIAALMDGAIGGGERDDLLRHMAECAKCRQIFTATKELAKEEDAGGERRWYIIPSALAAAVVLVVALTLTLRQSPTENVHLAKHGEPASRPEGAPEKGRQSVAKAEKPVARPKESHPASSDRTERMRARTERPAPESPLILLTAEEAAKPGKKSFGFANKLQQEGPAITVEDMEIEGDRPFPISVGFIPREGKPVNVATLKLECLKDTPIDLTHRVLPYANKDGVKIDRVSLPSGSYRFRVSVGDFNGRFSEKDFTVNVIGTF